jgi:hypothetical protein
MPQLGTIGTNNVRSVGMLEQLPTLFMTVADNCVRAQHYVHASQNKGKVALINDQLVVTVTTVNYKNPTTAAALYGNPTAGYSSNSDISEAAVQYGILEMGTTGEVLIGLNTTGATSYFIGTTGYVNNIKSIDYTPSQPYFIGPQCSIFLLDPYKYSFTSDSTTLEPDQYMQFTITTTNPNPMPAGLFIALSENNSNLLSGDFLLAGHTYYGDLDVAKPQVSQSTGLTVQGLSTMVDGHIYAYNLYQKATGRLLATGPRFTCKLPPPPPPIVLDYGALYYYYKNWGDQTPVFVTDPVGNRKPFGQCITFDNPKNIDIVAHTNSSFIVTSYSNTSICLAVNYDYLNSINWGYYYPTAYGDTIWVSSADNPYLFYITIVKFWGNYA